MFWPTFFTSFRSNESNKPQGTVCEGPKKFGNYCGSNKNKSLAPKRLLKTQISEKKATFPLKKMFTELSRFIGCDEPQKLL